MNLGEYTLYEFGEKVWDLTKIIAGLLPDEFSVAYYDGVSVC